MKKNTFKSLNSFLADIAVSYIKMHNLHWNVVGPQFKSVHEYLETIYDHYADVIDEIAEFIKIHGEFPAASLKEYLELTSIKELDSKDVKIEDAFKIALEDMKSLKTKATEARALADEEELFDVVGQLEDYIGEFNKNIWFIESALK